MITTAKALYNYFENNDKYISNAIKHDLFGLRNCRDEYIMLIILGVYRGLYLLNVSHEEIHKCFLENRLDELIHNSYKNRHSDYYDDFCRYDIKIGETYIVY